MCDDWRKRQTSPQLISRHHSSVSALTQGRQGQPSLPMPYCVGCATSFPCFPARLRHSTTSHIDLVMMIPPCTSDTVFSIRSKLVPCRWCLTRSTSLLLREERGARLPGPFEVVLVTALARTDKLASRQHEVAARLGGFGVS